LADILPDLLQRVFSLLRESGASTPEIVSAAIRAALNDPPIPRVEYGPIIDQATAVLSRWHTDPAYLANGRPAILKRRGSAPSVESLVASTVPLRMRSSVVEILEQSPSIRMSVAETQWQCCDDVLRLRGPAAAARVADVAEVALRTLLTNVGALSVDVAPTHLQCDVDALPETEVAEFMERANARLRPVIADMHEWLQKPRKHRNGTRTKTGRVGLLALGFVVPKRPSATQRRRSDQ
jgi:hypothetical protein